MKTNSRHNEKCISEDSPVGINKYLSEAQISELNNNIKLLTFNKGEHIVKQGMFVSHIFYVKKGLVKQIIGQPKDTPITFNIIPSERFIELPHISMLEYYPFGVVALKTSTVGVIQKEVLSSFLENNPLFYQFLLNQFNTDYLFLLQKFGMFHSKQAFGKVAEVLLQLSSERYPSEDIFNFITKSDISHLAGTSVESVKRTMKTFRERKIISMQNHRVMIKDYQQLKQISMSS